MNGRANNFPVNIWGLVLGLLATTAIAISGDFTRPFWNLPVGLMDFLRWFGWLLATVIFLWLFYQAKKGFEMLIGNAGGIELEFNNTESSDLGSHGEVIRMSFPEGYQRSVTQEEN